MSNAFKGMTAGLIATIVLSMFMVTNDALGLMPQINIIRWLITLGTLTTVTAWMDHFIVGVLVWGLLFASYDSTATRPQLWLKGIIFGVFAWLMMMMTFMPLAGAGFFGTKVDFSTRIGLLVLHLIYGLVLGVVYNLLGGLVPIRTHTPATAETATLSEADKVRFSEPGYSFNDDLPSGSPSAKSVLIFFGILAGLLVLVVLAVEFRGRLGF